MPRLALRKGWFALLPIVFFAIVPFQTASAANYTVTQENKDFYFELSTAQVLTVRTYAQNNSIDSMLWLYDNNNVLLAANDDYFGLDSYVSQSLQPGTYRLRAGVCCGNPNAWYGSSYTLEANLESTNPSPTTTLPPTTTTVSPSTTAPPTTTIPPTTTTTTIPPLPENQIWIELDEGQSEVFSAPDGYEFSEILFASYGTPNGSNGYYEVDNDCHAQNSAQIISSILIGNNSETISASNNVVGGTVVVVGVWGEYSAKI